LYTNETLKSSVNNIQSESLASIQNPIACDGIPLWKRALDIACIVAAAPAWVPLGIAIAAIIKLVSPGPVFFRQERVGYLGRHFGCLKFRTMKVNADTSVHQGHLEDLMKSNRPMTKLDKAGDLRLIPGGLLLRTLGLDELPQLINILKGEMSLVGPRPCLPYEFEKYLPRHRERCGTLPGLTGLWQTNGKNKTTFEEMIDLDVHYTKHKSLFMDLKIILMTIPALVDQAGDVSRARRQARLSSVDPVSVQPVVDQQY
jgi:lipopolysaccharide/colanic/teichoic acid biosynthesis glycosyltransferase